MTKVNRNLFIKLVLSLLALSAGIICLLFTRKDNIAHYYSTQEIYVLFCISLFLLFLAFILGLVQLFTGGGMVKIAFSRLFIIPVLCFFLIFCFFLLPFPCCTIDSPDCKYQLKIYIAGISSFPISSFPGHGSDILYSPGYLVLKKTESPLLSHFIFLSYMMRHSVVWTDSSITNERLRPDGEVEWEF
ncbi:MAG: hypothetical protein GY756_12850 [bacterium]|nr:hypothetical protein [bacterium]